jgi:hypothetical protein
MFNKYLLDGLTGRWMEEWMDRKGTVRNKPIITTLCEHRKTGL